MDGNRTKDGDAFEEDFGVNPVFEFNTDYIDNFYDLQDILDNVAAKPFRITGCYWTS
jgi:hypothetical protein